MLELLQEKLDMDQSLERKEEEEERERRKRRRESLKESNESRTEEEGLQLAMRVSIVMRIHCVPASMYNVYVVTVPTLPSV